MKVSINYIKYHFVFFLLPIVVSAQVVPEYKVNADTLIFCDGSSIIAEDNGNYIIAWTAKSKTTKNKYVYANYYDMYGNIVDGPIMVTDNHSDEFYTSMSPTISIGSYGRIAICWWANYSIWMQQYTLDGGFYPVNNNCLISDSTNRTLPTAPAIAQINYDNFIIAWKDDKVIFVQQIDANGFKTGDIIKVIENQSGEYLSSPSISSNGNDYFAVTWSEADPPYDIFIKTYKIDGIPIDQGSKIKVNTNLDSINNFHPNISMSANGNFIVCWVADENDIILQCFNNMSEPIGENMNITVTREADHYFSPCVSINNNKFLVVWVELPNVFAIYASRFELNGTPQKIGDDYPICHQPRYDSQDPKIKLLDDKIYTSWKSYEYGGSYDIRASVFNWDELDKLDNAINNSPSEYSLNQNFPNPFNSKTNITYSIKNSGKVNLKIYNLVGIEIKTLINNYERPGLHSIVWDSKDNHGNEVSSGLYFYRLDVGDRILCKKLLIIK